MKYPVVREVERLVRVEAAARAVVDANDHPPQDQPGNRPLADALDRLSQLLES